MTDACQGATGPQASLDAFVGGSTLGWGPVGPANWSAKHLVDGNFASPASWPGPILMAGWEFFNPEGLAQCFDARAAKVPPGWAMEGAADVATRVGAETLANAEIAYDVTKRAVELLLEWACGTARHTLPEWWADYGLPDDCGIDNLCAKVAAVGGATCEYFADLGALLGYDITCDDIPPEIQAGCWALGVDPMPPDPVFSGGGCELGYAYLGLCPDGDPPSADEGCHPWLPPAADPLLCGCAAPLSLDYTGTAHHVLVGLPQPAGQIPSTAIVGSWSLGCVPLCTPPREELLCFLARYRPAHVVAVPVMRPLSDVGDIDGGSAGTDIWLGKIDDGGA